MTINDIYPPDEQKRYAVRKYIEAGFGEGVHTSVIGKSILGRPIFAYRIGTGKINVLFVGAHHASEHITASVLYSFMMKILERDRKYGKYCGIDTRVYRGLYSLFIVPVLNPDGVETSVHGVQEGPLEERQRRMLGSTAHKYWQANARGVDLNHNYDAGFYEYKNIERERGIEPGPRLYSGEFPESEPEVRSLAALVRAVKFSLIVSLHTQGEEIYSYPADSAVIKRIAPRLAERLGYKLSYPEGTALYGGLCDYTSGTLGIPSITLELGRGTNPIHEGNLAKIAAKTDPAFFMLPTWL
jgi:g-D-glutamyl-meso-diaminopimelate peptidase